MSPASSAVRTDLVKAQLGRERQRAEAADPDDFLDDLDVVCTFERPREGPSLARIVELFQRTTQFNTTGRRFGEGELARHAEAGDVFVAHCRDRFGDYGLVAAAVVEAGEIVAFAMSCRVIGLKVEHRFLAFVLGRYGGVQRRGDGLDPGDAAQRPGAAPLRPTTALSARVGPGGGRCPGPAERGRRRTPPESRSDSPDLERARGSTPTPGCA